jgi:hypothetical protein
VTDREIERLCRLRPSLRGRLRRNPRTGCLLYVGKTLGRSKGNPLLIVHTRKKKRKMTSILLRRYVYQLYHGQLPPNRYPFMSCLNYRCVAQKHIRIVSKHRPYRNNPFLENEISIKRYVLVVRYFQGIVSSRALSLWFRVSSKTIRDIWDNKLLADHPLPDNFIPPPVWAHKAEMESHGTPSGHYLSPKNQKIALSDIQASPLTPTAKSRLRRYVFGETYLEISRSVSRDYSSIRESIRNALLRLYNQLGPKEWLCLLLKKPLPGISSKPGQ